MDLATFERLLTPAGQQVLARAEALHAEGVDALRAGEVLRRSPSRRTATRRRAPRPTSPRPPPPRPCCGRGRVTKLGPGAAGLFLTPDGLQQATRPEISVTPGGAPGRVAAERSPRRGSSVVDLGCGIGADLLAFAEPGSTWPGSTSTRSPPPWPPPTSPLPAPRPARGTVTVADATTVDRSAYDAVFVDPARRTARGRTFDVDAYSPPWSFVEEVLAGPVPAVVKVAPGIPHDRIPAGRRGRVGQRRRRGEGGRAVVGRARDGRPPGHRDPDPRQRAPADVRRVAR